MTVLQVTCSFGMNRTLISLALLAMVAAYAQAAGQPALMADPIPTEWQEYPRVNDGPQSRFLFVTTNATSVTVGYASFILGLTTLLVLGAVLALAYFYATGEDDGGSYGYSGYDSGYGSGRKSYVDSVSSRFSTLLRAVQFHPANPFTIALMSQSCVPALTGLPEAVPNPSNPTPSRASRKRCPVLQHPILTPGRLCQTSCLHPRAQPEVLQAAAVHSEAT